MLSIPECTNNLRHKCNMCDSVNVVVKTEGTASDNVPAEISYKCLSCGEFAYFAYGHYEDNRFNFSMIPDCDVLIFGTVEESNAKDQG